ncbi:hypothetical protein [Absidia glauca]|uniref:DUF159-domain-containing protein n=1 Tax=Absidia glauca TaxID=4829 RepID=A0A163J576_ABSGL|nr:hypothetical protein [Absidia glauca]
MCGRFCCSHCAPDLKTDLTNIGLNVKESTWIDQDQFRPRYNVAPRSFIPVVRQNDDKSHLVLQTMKWGLIPSFAKTMPDIQPINARDDTLLAGSPMYDRVKNDKRCIVVADGFYEWKKLGNGKKVPYYTKRKDGQLMLFAGLYDTAYLKDHDGPLHSTTIVTTDSSSFFAFLHDRMPVILERDQAETWLDPSSSWSTSLVKLMKPYKGELDCYQVTDKVGSVSNESSDFIVPVDSLKGTISNFFGKAPSPQSSTHQSDTKPPNATKRKVPDKEEQDSLRLANKKAKSKSASPLNRTHITSFFNKK